MDERKGKMKREKMEEDVGGDENFSVLMGDDVEPRRAFNERNAFAVNQLDI